jgi:hypothetical protein
VEVFSLAGAQGYQVRVNLGPFLLVACRRDPGRPYQPMVFATREAARPVAASLAPFLRPEPDRNQELYVNSRNFMP